jgi:hypothetical protein
MIPAILAIVLLALGAAAPSAAASDDETAGVVKNAAGRATVTRDGRTFPAAVGTKLREGDVLATGPGGSLGVILRDNSILSLGPESSLALRKFLFAPAQGKLGLLVRLTRGTLACISGLIGKLAPESVRFETPTATIGIRGTRFAAKAGASESR